MPVTSPEFRRAALAAGACAAIHVVAGVLMLLVLRPGLPLSPPDARAAFLSEHALAWRLGWISWMAGGLSFVVFLAALRRAVPLGRAGGIALGLAAAGLVPDFWGELRYILLYPGMAAPELEQADVPGTILSGGLGNLAYTAAWGTAAGVAARAPGFCPLLARLAWPGVAAGAGLSAVALAGGPPEILAIFTAATMGIFTLWSAAAARFFWKKAGAADRMTSP